MDWLTNAEKTLSGLRPVSRVLKTILEQIEDHKAFQKDVGVHRETMLHLDKKGTHLKYFSQKQDVILIKNLLIRSVMVHQRLNTITTSIFFLFDDVFVSLNYLKQHL